MNCAGIGHVGGIEETELADFQRLFRVNVDGTFLVTKTLPAEAAGGQGNA